MKREARAVPTQKIREDMVSPSRTSSFVYWSFLLESSIRNVYMRDFVARNVDVTHDVQFIVPLAAQV